MLWRSAKYSPFETQFVGEKFIEETSGYLAYLVDWLIESKDLKKRMNEWSKTNNHTHTKNEVLSNQ